MIYLLSGTLIQEGTRKLRMLHPRTEVSLRRESGDVK
jgi:hypothetical protein